MSDQNHYAKSGVNIDAGQRAVTLMKDAVKSTFNERVLSDTGAFGGLFSASDLCKLSEPVLVASTDGVGTKTMVAARMKRWGTIGQCLVNHCINDILVQGAQPLFFLDYVASSQLEPEQIASVVTGIATACRAANCALLGGETAEMPGVYRDGEIDLVGTVVGAVDRAQIIDGSRIQPGDHILALPSTGLHTNGFSLARAALAELDWDAPNDELGTSIGDALLAVHRSYLSEIQSLQAEKINIRGLAHITGGGIIDNLPRILPENTGAEIHFGSWDVPPIFTLIQRQQDIPHSEMFRVFNMGFGMLIVVPEADVKRAQDAVPDARKVGVIIDQSGINIQGI